MHYLAQEVDGLLNWDKKIMKNELITQLTDIEKDAIQDKLKKMTEFAANRLSAGKYWFDGNGEKRYVRINSNNYRAVSLDWSNPCGHLVTEDEKVVNGKILSSALSDAINPDHKNHKTGNGKPEH